MTKLRMTRNEIKNEAKSMAALIVKRSEAGIKAMLERSKQGFTEQEMRAAVKRHHQEAARMWNEGRDSSGE